MAFICPLPFDVDVSEEHCRSEAGLPDHPLGSLVVDVGGAVDSGILVPRLHKSSIDCYGSKRGGTSHSSSLE